MINLRMVGYLLGIILLIEAAFLVIPLIVALIFAEELFPFLATIAGLAALGAVGILQKPKNTRFYAKEGFICVGAAWVLMSLFGALPFVIGGYIPNYIDALFETVSGFTTTGASILTDIESLPKGILFWRSFTHWIGGMGVLMFMLAILPRDSGGSIFLLKAEVPGPTKGKIVPKIRETAKILYGIYIVLTVAELVALLIAGLGFYDATVTALATAGTGGFAVKNASILGYANPAAEWIIAIFMFIFGVNFNIYFFILIKRARDAFKSEELRLYTAICAIATALVTVNSLKMFSSVADCIRTSFFQVTSIMSTTGFVTVTNINDYQPFSKTILVLLMVFGACAGSTAGGLKISRIIIIFKSILREIKHMLRPRSVNVIKLDGEVVPEETVKATVNYLGIYAALLIVTTLFVSVDGYSLETNLTATISCLNNIGPFFGEITNCTFTDFSILSKILLSLNMLFGRLEIMPMIILLSPNTWKKH